MTSFEESEAAGYSVSISASGNTVAVGSPEYYNTGNYRDIGRVRLFDWTGTSWVQRGKHIEGIDQYDEAGFGISLSGDGNIVAVGAPNREQGESVAYYPGPANRLRNGSVRIFE